MGERQPRGRTTMSTIQKIVDEKADNIAYVVNPEAVPAAMAAITDLYEYLHKQLPFVEQTAS
jgi:hypothetical protein